MTDRWKYVVMTMPWGSHHYRYRDVAKSGWPRSAEVHLEGVWLDCPNVNVRKRIQNQLTMRRP